MNVRDLTEAFNCYFGERVKASAIKACLKRYKIRCGRGHKDRLVNRRYAYGDERVEFLRKNYPGRSVSEITDLFNAEFGTKKSGKQIASAVKRYGIKSGRTGRFQKGIVPWNAGTKGLAKPNCGSFKKGHVPANRRPVGSERISTDGYVEIKLSERDPYFNRSTRWKHKHVHVWEQVNGPVPDGCVIIFLDGNRLNCEDINNLELVTRTELLRINHYGYKNATDHLKPVILAAARLDVTIYSREKSMRGVS
jgi:hypothetical protein